MMRKYRFLPAMLCLGSLVGVAVSGCGGDSHTGPNFQGEYKGYVALSDSDYFFLTVDVQASRQATGTLVITENSPFGPGGTIPLNGSVTSDSGGLTMNGLDNLSGMVATTGGFVTTDPPLQVVVEGPLPKQPITLPNTQGFTVKIGAKTYSGFWGSPSSFVQTSHLKAH